MNYAAIKENKVVGIIKIESESEYQILSRCFENLIDTTGLAYQPQIGWELNPDGTLGVVSWKISKLSFQQRFTLNEQLALQEALNESNVLVQVLNKQFILATYIDLKRTDVIQGLGAMAQAGLITSQRMTEILTTPPAPQEIYKGNE